MTAFIELNNPDSTKTNANQVLDLPQQNTNAGLNIKLKTVDISSLNRIIDSTRIKAKPKKVIPLVKTAPFVPSTDTIESPVFNTFTGNFELPEKPSGWDEFSFTPINPIVSKQSKTSKKKHVAKNINDAKKIITEEAFVSKNTETLKGFTNTDWMLGVILVSFLLFGWINVRFSRFVTAIVGASYNYFAARRLQEEGNIVRNKVFFSMNILFFINATFIVTQWFEYNNFSIFGQNGIVLFLIFLAFIILIYSVKSMFLLLLDFIFQTKGAFLSYNSTVFIYNKLYAFILLPIVVAIPYVSSEISFWLLFFGLISFGILYIMRLFRGIQIGFKNRLSILYLILYLCALEILPLLLIYHTIKMYI